MTYSPSDRYSNSDLSISLPYREEPESLRELTSFESGAILWPNGEIMVGNWDGVNGLPRKGPAGAIVGMGDDLTEFEECPIPAAAVEAMIDYDIEVCEVPEEEQEEYCETYPDEFKAIKLTDHDVIVVVHRDWA